MAARLVIATCLFCFFAAVNVVFQCKSRFQMSDPVICVNLFSQRCVTNCFAPTPFCPADRCEKLCTLYDNEITMISKQIVKSKSHHQNN